MAAGGAAVRAASAEQDNVSRPTTTGTGFCVDVRPSCGSSWVSLRSRRYANAVVVVASKFKHGISIDDVKQAIILRCATAVYTVRVYASGESRVAAASVWLGGRGGGEVGVGTFISTTHSAPPTVLFLLRTDVFMYFRMYLGWYPLRCVVSYSPRGHRAVAARSRARGRRAVRGKFANVRARERERPGRLR